MQQELLPTVESTVLNHHQKKSDVHTLDCVINDEYPISCLKGEKEVYIPFSFLKKYFEINGKVILDELGTESFSWQHSYSKGMFE